MGDQCGKTEDNSNSFATISKISTSNKFNSTNIILSISRTCLSEDLAHRLLQQDLKTGWAIFENDCPGKHFFCCPVTKTKNSWISDTVQNHWQIKKFKSWLRWKSLTLRGWHWTSLLNPWFHLLLQNSNMLSAIIIIFTTIKIIIIFFRTRTCCLPFSAWSKRSMLQVWRWWSWPPGYPFQERWIFLNLSNVPRRKQGTQ